MKSLPYFRFIFVVLVACLLGSALAGCTLFSTIGGWFSGGYENTIAYFNAYYNARRIFVEAEAEVLNTELSARGKQSPTLQAGQISPAAKQKFTQVIDKCSHILSFYPESAVVDDALLLIGKSYYYQRDYVRAERKFSELLAQFPGGSLRLVGQLWFLKTLDKLKLYDDAIAVGEALANDAEEAGEKNVAGEARAILGSILTAQDLPLRAIEQYTEAVRVTGDGLLRAEAQCKIGDLYFSSKDYENASAAYLRVTQYSPDVYLTYYSRLQAALAFRHLKKHDTTIALLNELQDDYRLNDYVGMIRLELGITYMLSGRTADAVHEYRYVDTTYARTEIGARGAFELGKLLQSHYGDYEDAKLAYTHATQNPALPIAPEAQRRVAALDRYFRLQDEFAKTDSVLFVLDVDTLWIRHDTLDRTATFDFRAKQPDSLVVLIDSSAAPLDSSAIAQAIDSTLVDPDSARTTADTSLPTMQKPSRDSLNVVLSRVAFEIGEVFYSDLEIADSAFFWYNQSLKLYVDSARAPRTLFVLGEIMRADSARRYGDEQEMYQRLLGQFPTSLYAEQARIILGLHSIPAWVDPAATIYADAESLMDAGQYARALAMLKTIVEEHAASSFAAKSKYAMGWIYEHYLSNPDSALSNYEQVANQYGSTAYGAAARRRLPSASVTAPSDTTAKAPPQQPTDPARRLELRDADDEKTKPAPPDSVGGARGKRRVVVD